MEQLAESWFTITLGRDEGIVSYIKEIFELYPGLRLLRQPPRDVIFSRFFRNSNFPYNFIKGKLLGVFDETEFYLFPSFNEMRALDEDELHTIDSRIYARSNYLGKCIKTGIPNFFGEIQKLLPNIDFKNDKETKENPISLAAVKRLKLSISHIGQKLRRYFLSDEGLSKLQKFMNEKNLNCMLFLFTLYLFINIFKLIFLKF